MIDKCLNCKEIRVIHAKGLCNICYQKLKRQNLLVNEHELRVKELIILFKKKEKKLFIEKFY